MAQLITVAPGKYNEFVIMDKRVRLQGWGAGFGDDQRRQVEQQPRWPPGARRINTKATATRPTFDLLPGQTLGIDPANNEPLLFGAEEGPGILVVGRKVAQRTLRAIRE